jgi:NADPH:quinone reductase-like Zn-dependent oxidoreductase
VRVEAVSVNPGIDCRLRAGGSQFDVSLPLILGADPVGVVDVAGPGVDPRVVGQRVVAAFVIPCERCPGCVAAPRGACRDPGRLGVSRPGGYAEYVVVPESSVSPAPAGLDAAVACVVARHFPLAATMVRESRLGPHESVLVMGAGGGLGVALVQLAAETGATVIAASGDDRRLEAALDLGASSTVNYRSSDLADGVAELTGGRGVNVVFENIGDPALFPGALASLAHHGRMLTVGAHGGGRVPLDVGRLYEWRLSIHSGLGQALEGDLERCFAGAQAGRYRVLIDEVVPLSEVVWAHELAEARSGVGKVVLDPTR